MKVQMLKRQMYFLMLGAALSHFSIAQLMNTYSTPMSFGGALSNSNYLGSPSQGFAQQIPYPSNLNDIQKIIGKDLSSTPNGFINGPLVATPRINIPAVVSDASQKAAPQPENQIQGPSIHSMIQEAVQSLK